MLRAFMQELFDSYDFALFLHNDSMHAIVCETVLQKVVWNAGRATMCRSNSSQARDWHDTFAEAHLVTFGLGGAGVASACQGFRPC